MDATGIIQRGVESRHALEGCDHHGAGGPHRRGRHRHLQLRSGNRAGLSTIDAYHVANLVKILNDRVTAGILTLGAGANGYQNLTSNNPAFFTGTMWTNNFGTISASITTTEHWWGTTVHLDKNTVEIIARILQAGGGAAAVAMALQTAGIITAPSAAISAVIAACAFFAAYVLRALDWCNGVDFTNIPGVGWVGTPG